jgi:hypothetical protein
MFDYKTYKSYAEYLSTMNNGSKKKPLDAEEQHLREQAWNLRVSIDVEQDARDIPAEHRLSDGDIVYLLHQLAKFGNKQEKNYWKKRSI